MAQSTGTNGNEAVAKARARSLAELLSELVEVLGRLALKLDGRREQPGSVLKLLKFENRICDSHIFQPLLSSMMNISSGVFTFSCQRR